MAQSIPEMYGSLVFNDKVMRSKLPAGYRSKGTSALHKGYHRQKPYFTICIYRKQI